MSDMLICGRKTHYFTDVQPPILLRLPIIISKYTAKREKAIDIVSKLGLLPIYQYRYKKLRYTIQIFII